MVLLVVAGSIYAYAQFRFGQINKVTVGGLSTTQANKPINILLIGSNTRKGLKPSQAKYFGSSSQVGGARSDVTMIAHFDPATHQVSLVSIPRDLFMPIPNSVSANRVDAALNVSPKRLVATIQQDLGIPIQHVMELNFNSFQEVVQALGGVKMYFKMPVKDAYSGLNITSPGCKNLNGFQALEVVRSRHLYYKQYGYWHADPTGDLGRIRRDHEFLKVLAKQVQSKVSTNPIALNSIISSVVKYVKVDSGFTFNDMISLATQYQNVSLSTVKTVTLPVALENGPNNQGYIYKGVNYGDIVFPAEPQDTKIIDAYLGLSVPNISPRSITISVLNGTGGYQQASSIAHSLKKLGFHIATIGNATVTSGYYSQSVNPTETIIRYEPGYLSKAEVVKNALSGAVIMGQINHTITGSPIEIVAGTGLSVASVPSSYSQSSSSNSSKVPQAKPTLPATPSNQNLSPWDPRSCKS